MGICDDFMAEPFHRFRAQERALVQCQLEELTAGVEKLVSNPRSPDGCRSFIQRRTPSPA
jgi:hypothetical protein